MRNILERAHEKYFQPYANEDIDVETDYNIITQDLIKTALVLLTKAHDEVSNVFSSDNDLEKYKSTFHFAREKILHVTEITLAISYNKRNEISNKTDELAGKLQMLETSYYDEFESLFKKISQITKFTNKNALQSIVIRSISGERYNMDLGVLRENLLNTFLGYSRLLESIRNKESQEIEDRLLELLIYTTSLNILFNIETTDLCQ